MISSRLCRDGARSIRVRVPATSANLGPGFDAIGLALQLYNELTLSVVPGSAPRVEIEGEGVETLPRDNSHLSIQAANILFKAAGSEPPGWSLHQLNAIPLAAGLGSSAAAIIGGMVAANAFLDHPLGRERLLNLAVDLEGHPDNVAPALYGGMVISCRDGKMLRTYRDRPAPGLRLLLAVPEITLATTAARGALPVHVPHGDAAFNVGRAAALTAALIAGKDDVLNWATEDRLHQPYRYPLIPGAEAALAAARGAGAGGAAISGAGPTVIALWFERGAGDPRAELVSTALRSTYAAAGIRCRLIAAVPDHCGAVLVG